MIAFLSAICALAVGFIATTCEMSFSIPYSIVIGAILIATAIDKKNK